MARSRNSSSSETINKQSTTAPAKQPHDPEKTGPQPYSNAPLERIPSQNSETDANIYPEPANAVAADLERGGFGPDGDEKKQPGAVPGPPPGMAPADFPDGGLEAWLVVFGG
ncbi:hypothetical protein FZEAL_2437, partial [Fusarium zealandicum]